MALTIVGQRVELRSELEIAAKASTVWEVLINLRAYGEWNPFIVEAEGQLSQGGIVAITINSQGNRERRYRCRVLKCEPPSELRWSSTSMLRALSQSEQFFQLRVMDEARVRCATGEILSGLFAPRSQSELSAISQGLTLMNQAVKRRAEALQADARSR